jgi:hypothetical protein
MHDTAWLDNLAEQLAALDRLRQRAVTGPARVSQPRPVPWHRAEPLSAPRQQAIGAPREVHLHFHGASAEDIAEALRQLPGDPGQ